MYIVLSVIILIISFKLFKRAAGSLSLTKLNMISWVFYYNIIIQSFVGAILVVYKLDHHYFISKMNSDTSRVFGFYAVMYTAIVLPLGMVLCNKVLTGKGKNTFFLQYIKRPLTYQLKYGESAIRFSLSLLSIVSMLSVIYVFISIRSFPLLSALVGNSSVDELGVIRNEVGREFGGVVFIKNIFALTLMPLVSYIYYIYYRLTRDVRLKLWFIATAIFSFLILTYNLEKSPVLQYFVGFFFIKILLDDKINFRKVLKFGISLLVIVFCIYLFVLNQPIESLISYNTGFVGRLILGQSAGTYLSFDLFPVYRQHLGFSSISDLVSSLFELDHYERSARMVMEFYNPSRVDLGIAGVVSSLFIAEAWANFGLIGVLLSPLYVGFVTQFINIHLLKRRKTPIYVGLLAYLSYKMPITGGFNDFLYNPSLILIFFSLFFIISWSKTIIK